MRMPRIIVETFEVAADDTRRSLGQADFTWSVVSDMNQNGDRVRPMTFPPMVMAISPDLNDEQRRVGFAGDLAIPDFEAKVGEFVDAIGGLDAVPAAKAHLKRIADARSALEDAERMQATVAKATVGAATGHDMFEAPFGGVDFVEEPYAGIEDYGLERYLEDHPRPAFDDPGMARWSEDRSAWLRENAPPFVFGTRRVAWEGITEKQVRDAFENGPVDIDTMLEDEMSQHFDDAYDHIRHLDKLVSIVEVWEKHAGSGDAVDLGLGPKLVDWSGKQSISSYHGDRSIVVPVFDGVDADGIRQWCSGEVERAQATLAAIQGAWEPPVVAAPAP